MFQALPGAVLQPFLAHKTRPQTHITLAPHNLHFPHSLDSWLSLLQMHFHSHCTRPLSIYVARKWISGLLLAPSPGPILESHLYSFKKELASQRLNQISSLPQITIKESLSWLITEQKINRFEVGTEQRNCVASKDSFLDNETL